MATAPKRGSNENNKIIRGSSNLGANMFEPHHAYPHVHSRNKLGAPSHGTSPSPRPHSHSGPWPLGPRSLTKSAKAHQTVRKKWSPTKSTEDEFRVWNRCFPLRYRFHGCFGNKTLHGVTKRNWKDPWLQKPETTARMLCDDFNQCLAIGRRSMFLGRANGKRYLALEAAIIITPLTKSKLKKSYISSKSTELQLVSNEITIIK